MEHNIVTKRDVERAERRNKGLLARRMNQAAEHLAYDVWHYEKPNREAVDSALNHIARAVESLKAVGITLTVGGNHHERH